jgi:OFA family oxalate/formate antiporter-like MFS transporter
MNDTVSDNGYNTDRRACYIPCLLLFRNAQNFWQVLIGLCVVGFACGGYLATLSSFTADYFGAGDVGASYGIMFTAWVLCGFTVPKYFAGIMETASSAGNLDGGYNKGCFTLAVVSIIGIVRTFILKRLLPEVGE